MKVIIVGGVAGGATAAARLRRLDEKADITVFERTGYVSYANCGLPYYIGGVITDAKKLTVQTPEGFQDRFRICVKVRHEVTAINPQARKVTVENLETGAVFTEEYDKLLLSPGAVPAHTELPGADLEGVFSLRTVEDTLRITKYVKERKPHSVVLAGGGYIGLELAENLRGLGMNVTIVQRPLQLMTPLDPEMASFVHNEALANGVHLQFGCTVDGFRRAADNGIEVLMQNGDPLKADMAVLAIGITPDSALARKAGLKLGIRGSIVVDDQMRTSVPDIYAVGDAVQIVDSVTDEDALISLAGPANRQARIAADNMCGIESHYVGSVGSSILKFFSLTIATTGLIEKGAAQAGFDVGSVALSPSDHAEYYPGATLMAMKVVYNKKSGELLGAQIVGRGGVDKRIDVLACALRTKMPVSELKNLDLSYAPPYSSAKDPVNIAGYIAEDVMHGLVRQWYVDQAADLPRDGSVLLLDVRTAPEYEAGHADGFVNIDLNDLREHLSELDPAKPVYAMCHSGYRAYIACRILMQHGFTAYNLSGGFRLYEAAVNARRLAEAAAPCGMDKAPAKEVCSFPTA